MSIYTLGDNPFTGSWPYMVYAALAVLPALLLLTWLYNRDRLHQTSKRRVYRMYLLGAAIVLPAGLLERAMIETSVVWNTRGLSLTLTTAFFVAGLIEEFLKAAIVDKGAIQKGYCRTPMDCVIMSGAVALGFATLENILYVTSSGFETAILRSVTAIPAHLMFGIIMGSAFARGLFFSGNRALAYILPAIAHGIYDSFALSASWFTDVLLVVYLLLLMEFTLRRIDWAGQAQRRFLGHVQA